LYRVDRSTFENVQKWVKEARNNRGDDVMIAIVGNKIDDEAKREVTT
jgi:Ras-related protein Rab-6A